MFLKLLTHLNILPCNNGLIILELVPFWPLTSVNSYQDRQLTVLINTTVFTSLSIWILAAGLSGLRSRQIEILTDTSTDCTGYR